MHAVPKDTGERRQVDLHRSIVVLVVRVRTGRLRSRAVSNAWSELAVASGGLSWGFVLNSLFEESGLDVVRGRLSDQILAIPLGAAGVGDEGHRRAKGSPRADDGDDDRDRVRKRELRKQGSRGVWAWGATLSKEWLAVSGKRNETTRKRRNFNL